MTETKSGPALQQAAGSSLVAVMRRDAGLAEDYARRHGVRRWHSDAQALVDDPGVDVVYIATPPSTHRHYAIMAMRAGKPAYVEKPMALDARECDEMLRVSGDTGMPLFVAYYRRALPRMLAIRELLQSGVIGTPRSVDVRFERELQPAYRAGEELPWRVLPEISGGGLFVDLGSHTLDMLDFLFGPLHEVRGEAENRGGAYPAEDTVSMTFACGNGIRGSGTWDFQASARRDEIIVKGDGGSLRFPTFGAGPMRLENAAGVRSFAVDDPPHVQQPLIQTLVDQLHDKGSCPSTGESAARTTAVIDCVLHDYRLRNGFSAGFVGRTPGLV